MSTEMHGDSTPRIFENARLLRRKLTPPEAKLWNKLKDRRLSGLKFRRQHAISKYVADFYCHELKLVIEVDGGYHNSKDIKELDDLRTMVFEDFGIRVIRFTNDDVMNDFNKVLSEIRQSLISSI